MTEKLTVSLTPRQTTAFKFLTDEETRYILYGGAKGGGKSFLLCLWVLAQCRKLCGVFNLSPSKNPLMLGFIGRKQGVDFKKTTLETFKRFIPRQVYEINRQDNEIIFFDGACKIFFGGLDRQETINKFNSAELAFFAIDQAEETTREEVSVLRGAMRLTSGGITPAYKELYTANPADCWLKEDFVDNKTPRYKYIPALPTDNPYLPENYVQTLEEAFKYSPPLLRAYRDGDWSSLKATNSLLSTEDIKKLEFVDVFWPQSSRVVCCDPATTHDECVIYVMHDYKIIDQKIIVSETDEMKIAGHIAALAKKHDCLDVGGDTIGLGAGIFSRLEEIGSYRVHRINSAQASFDKQFKNLRADIFWNLMKKVLDKKVGYPNDEELRRQLVNITYEIIGSNGEIIITSKDKIKRIIGRSPDRADCFAMACWLMDRVDPFHMSKRSSYSHDDDDEYSFSPMGG